MADPEKIVFYTPEGALAARGGYDVAVRRLYETLPAVLLFRPTLKPPSLARTVPQRFCQRVALHSFRHQRGFQRFFLLFGGTMAVHKSQRAAAQQYQNAVNNAQGHSFEDYIKSACVLPARCLPRSGIAGRRRAGSYEPPLFTTPSASRS